MGLTCIPKFLVTFSACCSAGGDANTAWEKTFPLLSLLPSLPPSFHLLWLCTSSEPAGPSASQSHLVTIPPHPLSHMDGYGKHFMNDPQ